MIVLLLACSAEPEGASNERRAVDYAGVVGARLYFAPPGTPDEVPLALEVGEGTWALRMGGDWDEATPLSEHVVDTAGALLVDGTELLPADPGSSTDFTTYYGTFPDTVSSTVGEGSFAGPWTFARDIGPVYLAVEGVERELVYYAYARDTGG